ALTVSCGCRARAVFHRLVCAHAATESRRPAGGFRAVRPVGRLAGRYADRGKAGGGGISAGAGGGAAGRLSHRPSGYAVNSLVTSGLTTLPMALRGSWGTQRSARGIL